VAEEIGTWPAEQATVLLEVLNKAGLSPEAKRTREGIVVTVPDDQAAEANRQLVANMDRIAQAARQPRPSAGGQRRRPRPVKGADAEHHSSPQALASERLLRLARPLGLLIIAMLLFAVIRHPLVVAVVLGALIYVVGKRAQQDGDDPPRLR